MNQSTHSTYTKNQESLARGEGPVWKKGVLAERVVDNMNVYLPPTKICREEAIERISNFPYMVGGGDYGVNPSEDNLNAARYMIILFGNWGLRPDSIEDIKEMVHLYNTLYHEFKITEKDEKKLEKMVMTYTTKFFENKEPPISPEVDNALFRGVYDLIYSLYYKEALKRDEEGKMLLERRFDK